LQAMKDWHKLRPELFKKQPYYLTGCDTYPLDLGQINFCVNMKYYIRKGNQFWLQVPFHGS